MTPLFSDITSTREQFIYKFQDLYLMLPASVSFVLQGLGRYPKT